MAKPNIEVCVIGGGAAGMLAAGLISEKGLRVTVIEKNDGTCKKLGITGKGRCNITNDCSVREAIEAIPTNGRFLYSALSEFSPADTIKLFEKLGVPLKTERGGRVFPVSDRAEDVVSALRCYASRGGVNIVKARAVSIRTEKDLVSAVITDRGVYPCSCVLLAAGGMSYPHTGSTGDGYTIAASMGHNIISPRPSLVPLCSPDSFCSEMQGLSLRNVTLKAFDSKNKLIFKELGELLFTHFGISGPLSLSASAHMRDFSNDRYRVSIDLKPGLDEMKLDRRILRDFENYSNRDFINALSDLANRKMIPVLVKRSGISPDTKVHSITREQRLGLVRLFKEFSVEISEPRPISEAIITSGGVDVREIDPKTMRSKIIRGLCFAGEVIDADAYTGGFNLQIAWSTAYAAASHMGKEE